MSKAPSDRTRVKRLPKRGAYDEETLHAILDEGLVCHVGFAMEGQPYVMPMTYARDGDQILIHGSKASRAMKVIAAGADVCVTVTHNDGLVLARSAFHHSMNYRSVVVLGKGRAIDDPEEKLDAFRRYFDRVIPGRWSEVRPPNAVEMNQTLMVAIPIDEASAKARTGPPSDEAEDYALDVWAGVIPMETIASPPEPDDQLRDGIAAPDYAIGYSRRPKS
jgi:nitroimidazol reductase NimA-like FMN-containing flavoprotein (pyridoxamine 5'-phosphate oxidase superfamily)